MVRNIEVYIPKEEEKLVGDVITYLRNSDNVHRPRKLIGDTDVHITFCCVDKKTDTILGFLHRLGVGIKIGFINILELQSTIPRITTRKNTNKKGREYNVSDRLSTAEIYSAIESKIHLTFDYLAMVIVASLIAGVGLIQADSAIVVASMIVSPLMNPILGITLGVSMAHSDMVRISLRNEAIGVALCFLVGMICGGVVAPFHKLLTWPTASMVSRGTATSIIGGVAVAIPSGVGVAIAITGNISSSLVGVAISAALLPPIVNSGMNLAYGIVSIWIRKDPAHGVDSLEIATYSMILFLVNFVIIFLVAAVMFRMKTITHRAADVVTVPRLVDSQKESQSAFGEEQPLLQS